jgi:hypothetical protein
MRKTERTPSPWFSLPTGWHCAQSTYACRSSDKPHCHHCWRSCTCYTDRYDSASISQATRRSEKTVESPRKGVVTGTPRFTVRQENSCCLHGSKGSEGFAVLFPRLVGCRARKRLLPWVAISRRGGGRLLADFDALPHEFERDVYHLARLSLNFARIRLPGFAGH